MDRSFALSTRFGFLVCGHVPLPLYVVQTFSLTGSFLFSFVGRTAFFLLFSPHYPDFVFQVALLRKRGRARPGTAFYVRNLAPILRIWRGFLIPEVLLGGF